MRVIRNIWPVGLALLTLAASLSYLGNAWANQPKTFLTVFYFSGPCTLLLAFLVIPSLLLVIVIRFNRIAHNSLLRRESVFLKMAVFLLIGANAIACAALPPILLNPYRNLNTLFLGDHLYRLDTIYSGVWGDLNDLLLVWECDEEGLYCRVIHARDYYSDMDVRLTTEPKSNSILFIINDKIVYEYSPDQGVPSVVN